ncbi:hypothetical protein L915_15955 [Phytophthora nicotianae]|uniref:Uncharacterized protein n=1 Tax=Phytophthora nicotianae TaxID=4792 RepID=W2G705_PHYNI|nr:hypothetical protein L915_15955 [Phytophthora nicotianae]
MAIRVGTPIAARTSQKREQTSVILDYTMYTFISSPPTITSDHDRQALSPKWCVVQQHAKTHRPQHFYPTHQQLCRRFPSEQMQSVFRYAGLLQSDTRRQPLHKARSFR